jgi:hypothetical protein
MSALPPEQKEAAEAWIQGQVAKGEIGSYFGGIGARILCTNTAVEIPDIRTDGTRPADTLWREWNAQEERVVNMYERGEITPVEHDLKLGELWVGSDHTRDMHFVGRMGSHMADRHQPGRISQAALLTGALHANVGVHLAARNVQVAQQNLQGMPLQPIDHTLIKMTREVRFNPSELLRHHRRGS